VCAVRVPCRDPTGCSFPPCTLLEVLSQSPTSSRSVAQAAAQHNAQDKQRRPSLQSIESLRRPSADELIAPHRAKTGPAQAASPQRRPSGSAWGAVAEAKSHAHQVMDQGEADLRHCSVWEQTDEQSEFLSIVVEPSFI
jgi:hypothetical protein